MFHSNIAQVNRFNVTLMGMGHEEKMLDEFEKFKGQTADDFQNANAFLQNVVGT